jgi:nucleotide-binding universal stress UspA family protein
MKRVLMPVDFSPRDAAAAHYVKQLHNKFSFETILLHVVPPPDYEAAVLEAGGPILQELMDTRRKLGQDRLDATCHDELAGMQVERVLLEGFPSERIVEYAKERGVDLIVLPTHGYGPFRRFILGSVTAKVLHDADCPVWTGVHLEAESAEQVQFRKVVAALDLGQQSERTLMWASRFAQGVGAQLTLVHATPNLEGQAGEYFDPDWRKHVETQVREQVDALQQRLNTHAPLLVDSGDASTVVCQLAQEAGADLLVIGRGSAAGVFGRLRANAYSIIRQSTCPVVSV